MVQPRVVTGSRHSLLIRARLLRRLAAIHWEALDPAACGRSESAEDG